MRCFGSGWRFVVAHPAGMLTVRHFARYIDASGGCGIYYRRGSRFGRNGSQFEQRRVFHRHSRLSRPQKQVTFLPYYRYLSLNAVIPDSSFGKSMRSCIFFSWNHFHSSAAWNLINFDANIAFSCRHRQEKMAIIIIIIAIYEKKSEETAVSPDFLYYKSACWLYFFEWNIGNIVTIVVATLLSALISTRLRTLLLSTCLLLIIVDVLTCSV